MKRRLFPLLLFHMLFLGSLTTVSAQIGIKGGLNLASFAEQGTNPGAQDIKGNSVIGAVAGLTFDLDLADNFTVQPELLYIQKGGKKSYKLLGTRTDELNSVNYVEIPVMAKIRFGNTGDDGGLGCYFGAGPWAGLAINGKVNASIYDINENKIGTYEDKYTVNNEDNRKRLDYGASGCVGLVFGKMILEARYNYGINNVLDKDANNSNDTKPILQTRGISVTIGIVL
jgi:hypothetical protein